MHSFTSLTALLALPILSFGAPAPQTSDAPSELSTIRYYSLKTADANNKPERFNNLYVGGYHTGAGLGDAVLYPGPGNENPTSFLNSTLLPQDAGATGSYQQFGLPRSDGYAWTMSLSYVNTYAGYAGWDSVTIDLARHGPANFSINAAGLQSSQPGFGGWMACDWSHGGPQLFWKLKTDKFAIPECCAVVNLVPEYAS